MGTGGECKFVVFCVCSLFLLPSVAGKVKLGAVVVAVAAAAA